MKKWIVRVLLWAIIGAVLGALWGLFHYGTESQSGSVIVLAAWFGLAGAILSLLVGKGCRT